MMKINLKFSNMENMSFGNQKLLIGFGAVAVLCGIGLIAVEQFAVGISTLIVGVWLVLENVKQMSL